MLLVPYLSDTAAAATAGTAASALTAGRCYHAYS
jgi:hypothetical protein